MKISRTLYQFWRWLVPIATLGALGIAFLINPFHGRGFWFWANNLYVLAAIPLNELLLLFLKSIAMDKPAISRAPEVQDLAGKEFTVEYEDQNDAMRQFLPRSGSIVREIKLGSMPWLLMRLDEPFTYSDRYSHTVVEQILLRSCVLNGDISRVNLRLVPNTLPVGNTLSDRDLIDGGRASLSA